MPITTTGYSHVRLTVTDIERSRAFYDAVFGLPVVFEVPADADDATRERLGFLFGLRPVADDAFDENRVGLDHLSFSVAGLPEIEAAAAVLQEHGIEHSGIKDLGRGYILEFRDPDNIAPELYALKG